MRSHRDLVDSLAEALDLDDYATVSSLLATDVEYVIGDQRHIGVEAVISSYRDGSEMAHRLFDKVLYRHAVFSTEDPDAFRVEFTDEPTVGDETLTHRVEQHMTVSPDRGVVRIIDVVIPGEQDRVDAFLGRHGLTRDR